MASPAGCVFDGDLHDPDKILIEAAQTLDFIKPLALMVLWILDHVPDPDEACAIVPATVRSWLARRRIRAVPRRRSMQLGQEQG